MAFLITGNNVSVEGDLLKSSFHRVFSVINGSCRLRLADKSLNNTNTSFVTEISTRALDCDRLYLYDHKHSWFDHSSLVTLPLPLRDLLPSAQ